MWLDREKNAKKDAQLKKYAKNRKEAPKAAKKQQRSSKEAKKQRSKEAKKHSLLSSDHILQNLFCRMMRSTKIGQ